MNVSAKIPRHIRVRILGPVRHANILRSIMNVDLRNNRIETVVPVVITFDKNKLAVQPLFELSVFLYSTFFPSLKYKVSEKEDGILRLDPLIMLANDCLIPLLDRLKRPVTIPDDIEVRKMII